MDNYILPGYALLLQVQHVRQQLSRAQGESSAGVSIKVINDATSLTSFMETGEKTALSRTVKHGALSSF